MIIRALRLRHGRIALPRTLTLFQAQYRQQSSVEIETPSRVEAPDFVNVRSSTAQQQLDAIPSIRAVQLNDPNHPVAQDYAFFQHQKARTQHLGTAISAHYRPHTLVNDPPSPEDITLELLLASQAHIGHATSLWHPANSRYIFGVRGRKKVGESPVHIISLEATAAHLRRACKVVSGVAERGGLILFVGTREGQARAVVKAAQLAKGCHLFTKWIPGSITNGQQILGRCAKKVVDEKDQEVEGFDDQLATKAALKPDLVVCLNPLENYTLLHECGLNNIPTVGIIDTDANPTWVTYPIPANDDSLRCVQVIVGVLGRAAEQGQATRQNLANRGISLYPATHGLSVPSQQEIDRQKRVRKESRERSSALPPAAVANAEPNLPEDLEGVEVKQYLADQALLREADQQYIRGGNDTTIASATDDLDHEDEEDDMDLAAADAEEAEDDLDDTSELDRSLLDDSYTEDMIEDDLNQFGGAEQLHRTQPQTPSSEVLPDTTNHASDHPKQPDDTPQGESPLEQIEGVEKELGEEPGPAVPAGNPDVRPPQPDDDDDAPAGEDGKKKRE